ncbi:hypothetical protein F0562_001245 [Nyssa sinensis]|uniref:Aldehyde oxidase/xanthine dehydrogenase second molybdopterin binding domain-containing protein n=1 Tax=Nyssa sinensis TaxID=561372 RepID=A0A5J5C765_9ASTE|nr:hypothetical protein F0562_001245 [Nyssa sinensis]
MFHSDDVYEIPNVRVSGRVCFTNLPSNTAFRGLGGPQGMLITENWIQIIAMELKRTPEEIRAGALVQVYTDGTVLVTPGGVEMGQGLHTKVAQIAASSFNIPLSSVFTSETSTDNGIKTVVPNASPTAASASSDMYGAAVLDACEQIKARMEPISSKHNFNSFAERIDLSAHGFYITPDSGFDWKTGKGNPFRYFTYGATFAEVKIATLTGDFHTRTANIFLDLGYSLNPDIDVGQVTLPPFVDWLKNAGDVYTHKTLIEGLSMSRTFTSRASISPGSMTGTPKNFWQRSMPADTTTMSYWLN